jgi:hypothetical protein
MKRFLCLIILFVGCAPLQRQVENAKDRLILTETKLKTEAVRMSMCEARAEHSARCSGECILSHEWHKSKWNK